MPTGPCLSCMELVPSTANVDKFASMRRSTIGSSMGMDAEDNDTLKQANEDAKEPSIVAVVLFTSGAKDDETEPPHACKRYLII